jgi:hypothetical protein
VLSYVRGFPKQLWVKADPLVHGRIGGEQFGPDFSMAIYAFKKLHRRWMTFSRISGRNPVAVASAIRR